jgi:predicted alpha/beta hydrolase
MIVKQSFFTTCDDGVVLKGLLFIPKQPKGIIQFNGGTATKKEFYFPFITFLAENNYLVCSWDYRGSGESAPKYLSKCEYTYSDYGSKDMPAIKSFLTSKYPELPILVFGHSAGGQQVGLMHNCEGYKGMVSFAVSTGYAPQFKLSYRLMSFYFFYIFSPVSIFLKGYVQAKPFGYMENLPKNVVLQWRDWCNKKEYFFHNKFYRKTIPEGFYNDMPFPIHLFWTNDDKISNEKNTRDFWQHVKSGYGISFHELIPAAYQEKEINHFGFFKKSMSNKLWPLALQKLNEFLER